MIVKYSKNNLNLKTLTTKTQYFSDLRNHFSLSHVNINNLKFWAIIFPNFYRNIFGFSNQNVNISKIRSTNVNSKYGFKMSVLICLWKCVWLFFQSSSKSGIYRFKRIVKNTFKFGWNVWIYSKIIHHFSNQFLELQRLYC